MFQDYAILKHACTIDGMDAGQRRREAARMRAGGVTIRQIGAALGVSHPTVIRDLRAVEAAEREAIMAALAGEPPQAPAKRRPADPQEQAVAQESSYNRWAVVHRLAERGWGVREIARQLGTSPATVSRDLRDEHGTRKWYRLERRTYMERLREDRADLP